MLGREEIQSAAPAQSEEEYQIEPELLTRPPRRVRWILQAAAFLVIIVPLVLFAALWDGFIGPPPKAPLSWFDLPPNLMFGGGIVAILLVVWREISIARWWVAAPARIVDKTMERSGNGRTYTLKYEFYTSDADQEDLKTEMGEQVIDKRDWEKISVNNVLTVLYSAKNPKKNCLYRFCLFRAAR